MKKKKVTFLSIFFHVFPYLGKIDSWNLKIRAAISLLLIVITIAINSCVPIVLKNLIAFLSLPNVKSVSGLAVVYLLSYGTTWTLGQMTWQIREVLAAKVFARILRLVCSDIFKHIMSLSMKFHVQRHTGAVASAISQAQTAIPMIALGVIFWITPTILEICIASAIITYFYGIYYGLMIVGLLMVYILSTIYGSNYLIESQYDFNKAHIKSGAILTDSLLNIETVKYFDRQDYETYKGIEVLKEREEAEGSFYQNLEFSHLIQGLIIGFGLTTLTFVTGKKVMLGVLNIEDFVMINGYLLQFVYPLMLLSKIVRDIRKSTANMQNVMHLLSLFSEIKEAKHPKKINLNNSDIKIDFENVEFKYHNDIQILRDVSFSVNPGETVAIVGATGGGKSTITKLLFRFYDVYRGEIKINGINIKNLSLKNLNSLFAVVPQSAVMFNDTIGYNIRYSNFQATEDEVYKAIKSAKLDRFIKSLPYGLDTRVGEHGVRLSGGERQRIAIARAILKKPKVFIFDEATSALDTKTEKAIQSNLQEISANSSTIIIAHRLSTITYADKILVIKDGKISESGTHNELLEKQGSYSRLWQQQFEDLD